MRLHLDVHAAHDALRAFDRDDVAWDGLCDRSAVDRRIIRVVAGRRLLLRRRRVDAAVKKGIRRGIDVAAAALEEVEQVMFAWLVAD